MNRRGETIHKRKGKVGVKSMCRNMGVAGKKAAQGQIKEDIRPGGGERRKGEVGKRNR